MHPQNLDEPGRQPANNPRRSRQDRKELRQAAHRYADTGWPVFPCQPGSKRPATRHGHLDATTSHARIDRWWTREPAANIGLATGAPGPDVLDIDLKPGRDGFAALRLASQAGLIPSPIASIRTPSGGAHLYFPGTKQRCGALPAFALDFRATGGFVIAPPSWSTRYQRRYRQLSSVPGGTPVDWTAIRDLLSPPKPRAVPQRLGHRGDAELVARLTSWIETRPEGNRNYPLFWAARLITASGLMDAQAREQLIAASLRSGLRGGEAEARRTVASGEKAGNSMRIPPS
jgi:Bifunctional DNA primase/polymerase, N-terminal